MKTLIAVSGDAGSFSEEAGLQYAKNNNIDAEMDYAIDMEGVLSEVENQKAELGVFPVTNSRGGLVQTAYDAMGRHLFTLIDQLKFEVHHCLMVKPKTKKQDIKRIATHPQAISQCENYIKENFSNAEIIEWEDTALAAKDLSNGKLSEDTAVIAPARSAEIYGLEVLERGIQDENPNITTFIIVKKYEE